MRAGYVLSIILAALLCIACASSDHPAPTHPELYSGSSIIQETRTGRAFWGIWEIRFTTDHLTAEVLPLRTSGMHLNVVNLVEFSPCSTCLTITDIISSVPGELHVNLNLTHPVPGDMRYTGFDVRGILVTGSDLLLPELGRSIAWGDNYPSLINSDGYTQLFNPTEFDPNGPGPAVLKYVEGKFAPGGNLTATLNPYLLYADEIPRNMFLPGETNTRTAVLRLPDGPLSFGYAVDASWIPHPLPVVDPYSEFPPEANCIEAWKIKVETGSGFLSDPGSETTCEILVRDHQGFGTFDDVIIEAPDLFDGLLYPMFYGYVGTDGFRFKTSITNEYGAPDGEYPLLVRVIDDDEDTSLGPIDAWQVHRVTVGPKTGWVRTWGGNERDACWDIEIDDDGNIYTTGSFQNSADLDPGSGVDIHTADGANGAYLTKFDPDGGFLWSRTWSDARGLEVALDESGNVHVAGEFIGLVDFDPGTGIEEQEALGLFPDCFLSRFASDGEFQWVSTWGAPYVKDMIGAIVPGDMGSTYICGGFNGTADFNPGSETEYRTSNGEEDAYLLKLDYYGNLDWVMTWGGEGGVSPNKDDFAVAVSVDDSGGVYVAGHFHSLCDFDPGDGIEEVLPIGWEDGFLLKLNSSGDFHWVRTWGGTSSSSVMGMTVMAPSAVFITGYFSGIVDFDPGPDIDEHSTIGSGNGFITRYSQAGNYQWTRQFGEPYQASGTNITFVEPDNLYVTGFFNGTADLNTSPGVEQHESNGWMDALLINIDTCGEYMWSRSWGGVGILNVFIDDESTSVEVDSDGNILVTGHFENSVDFEPGPEGEKIQSNGLWDSFLVKFTPDGTW